MSATNHTTNYNLPQFIGTDKPTWLTDVNGAMSAIDTQMKANADSATSASTSATTANTNIGTLANLETTAKTDAVSAINEVNNKAGNAQSTANTAVSDASNAQTTANEAKTLAQTVASFININNYNSYTDTSSFTRLQGTGTATYANFNVATNADKSLAKVYGSFTVSSTSSGAQRWKLTTDTGLRPDSQIAIRGITTLYGTNGKTGAGVLFLNTDGTIEFEGYNDGAQQYRFDFYACIIFVKDFGDTPEQN